MAKARVATTVAGILASEFENGDAVDGTILATGDVILLKNQVVGTENGMYDVNITGAPTRNGAFPSGSGISTEQIFVIEGTVNANSTFICANAVGSDVVGTDALVFEGNTAPGVETSQIFSAYDAAGGLVISAGLTDIPWDTEIRKDSIYTHTASSTDITFGVSGDFLVTVDISIDLTVLSGSAGRCSSLMRFMLNTGGGFIELRGTRAYGYHRNTASGEDTLTVTRLLSGINNGDIFKVQAARLAGPSTLATIALGSRINIEKKSD